MSRQIWNDFYFFENEPMAKQFLTRQYQRQGELDCHILAYKNTHKFIYYIKQARAYYETAEGSHIIVKPLLLYYGMTSLVKAVLTSLNPYYPQNTRVLKHGISTRKLKKAEYQFHKDEIKIQKDGLLPLFLSYFLDPKKLKRDKFTVIQLLSQLPELTSAYQRLYNDIAMIQVHVTDFFHEKLKGTPIFMSEKILDEYHMTYSSFLNYMNQFNEGEIYFSECNIPLSKGTICYLWNHPSQKHLSDVRCGIQNKMFSLDDKGHYFIRLHFSSIDWLPEICIHLILMYILGMLCRYETELWGEIIFSFTSGDMYIINEFLHLSEKKFPILILQQIWK
ncbi:YaaC family protein [Microaerobacter geothermalis]|uniref:YaaC family protein n=1 Tax=Microaerobacter geothermalis TaxID=674972 RepID=UPI0022A680F2|nr:YaaC family protein [Microaerobacter geothermalis]MCF6095257.1 YaaC family protein [Microaerobacter geothermalis]